VSDTPPPPSADLPVPTPLPSQRDSELPSLSIPPVAPATLRGRRIALAIVTLASFLAVAYMAAPLWVGLVIGTVMAFTGQPLYRRLAARMHNRRALAALFTTLIGGIGALAGGGLTLYILWRELFAAGTLLKDKVESGAFNDLIPEHNATLESMGLDRASIVAKIGSAIGDLSSHAAQAATVILSTTAGALLSLVIALFTMYYVLLEWSHIAVRLEKLLPLDPRHTRALMLEFRDVARSAFVGTLATAAVQGLFGGIGYAVAGVPQPITWGVLTALGSFIPMVGTAIIYVPIGIYLIVTGHVVWGIFVLAWGALVVMAVSDYVVRPRLVGSHGEGHPLLMLIALLGGIEVFGLAGLIVGPVVMSLFLAVTRIYEREVGADDPPRPK
jgi:predicted PurR-regulated permease PerM